MTDKIKTEKTKVNLETNRMQLLGKKNSLVAKRKKLRAEIIILNITNIPIRGHQDPLLKPTRDKLKAKRPPPFDNLKKNLQKFLIETRYYQEFYQQSLPFDSDKIQNIIINMVRDTSK